MDKVVKDSRQSVGMGVSRSGKFVANGLYVSATNVGSAVTSSASFVGRVVSTTASAIISVPKTIISTVTNTNVVRSIITPSDNTPIPMIESPLQTAYAEKSTVFTKDSSVQTDSATAWPMSGRITTEFGVPHWPFQPSHTGIDISDGKGSGNTQIKPFKAGRVIKVVYSYSGLGNHIIIDHGGGIISLYGHLSSINVGDEQEVELDTVLGLAGSTGVSTGTHLHFEIMKDGKLVDPSLYIEGQP
ncbi:MAG: M23 family metallopeptidase [bacterium]|nr:M23 family metallopeptidase [bacterium]